MKKNFLLIIALAISAQLGAQSVVVNKYFNQGTGGAGTAGDAVELLVIQNNLDMRGMIVKDFTSSMANDAGGKFTFANIPLWNSVPSGTLIILRNNNSAADTVASDFVLDVGLQNGALFTNGGGTFDIATTEMIMIKAAGSGVAGVTGSIHALAGGTVGAQFTSAPEPKLIASGTSGSMQYVFANNATQSLSDFNGTGATGAATGLTLGQGNNATNTAFINSIRNAPATPVLQVSFDNAVVPNNSRMVFPETANGQTARRSLVLRNLGRDTLFILSYTLSDGTKGGSIFNIPTAFNTPDTLLLGEALTLELTFTPRDADSAFGSLLIDTNDPLADPYSATIVGKGRDASSPLSIAEARALPLGSVVTVTGRITVSNQFGGPAYFQDPTGGMAAFIPNLHAQAQLGDSVVITGATTEFQPTTTGVPGGGLFQIAEVNGVVPSFQIIAGSQIPIQPRIRTLNQINESLEGQLVIIEGVTISQLTGSGAFSFQGNANYNLTDASGTLQMRIDNDVTTIIGAAAPTVPVTVTGVVSEFRGTRQILPRFVQDIPGISTFVIPYENIPRSQTFEAVTWNIEWFGSPSLGPTDNEIQLRNAAQVIRTIDADVYALQEISDNDFFRRLVDSVAAAGYKGFVAPISQTQKTAYIYKTATVDSISAAFTFTTGDWANGRFPYEFIIDARINGRTRRINLINIHGKATQDTPQQDYDRRVADSQQLKTWLDANRSTQNIIFLGDYNDDVDVSTFNNLASPYSNFVLDTARYKAVTKSLSDRRQQSQSSGEMIDHITISNELFAVHLDSAERVENPSYIGNYLSTASDHYPVWTRFDFSRGLSTPIGNSKPTAFALNQNYPNPFNPTTVIGYQLPKNSSVKLRLFDVLGRTVATLVNERQTAGAYSVNLDAAALNLSSGVYFYRLEAESFIQTKKMLLVK